MPNIGGPQSKKRKLLLGVVHSILLYGAPLWGQAMQVQTYRKVMEATHGKAAIRVASAYRTVSLEAKQVITDNSDLPIGRGEEKSNKCAHRVKRYEKERGKKQVTKQMANRIIGQQKKGTMD